MKEHGFVEGDESLEEIIKNDCFLNFAKVTFESAKELFVERGCVEMMAFLIKKILPPISDKDMTVTILPVQHLLNADYTKDAVVGVVKELAKRQEADAICFVFESWMVTESVANMQEAIERHDLGISIKNMKGSVEAITLSLDSPNHNIMIMAKILREEGKPPIVEKCTWNGLREGEDNVGRFSNTLYDKKES